MAKQMADSPMKMPTPKPTIRLTDKDLPALKDKTVDEVFNIYAKVKVNSIGRDDWVEGKPLSATLDVLSVSENTKMTLSEDELNAAHLKAGQKA